MANTVTLPTKAMVLYAFIVQYKQNNDGLTPSYREMASGMGLNSTSSIQYYLNMLSDAGIIKMDNGKLYFGGTWKPPQRVKVLS